MEGREGRGVEEGGGGWKVTFALFVPCYVECVDSAFCTCNDKGISKNYV